MFQYTENGKYLTNEQRQFYEDNGYLIVRNLVDQDLLDICKYRLVSERFRKISLYGPTTPDMFVMKEHSLTHKNLTGEDVVKKIINITNDEVFFQYSSYKPLVDIVSSIIGNNITSCQGVMLSKPPNAEPESSEQLTHQDFYYIPFGPANSLVTSWTATEPAHKENGGLYVYPGSHKKGLVEHVYAKNNKNVGYYYILDVPKTDPVYLTADKGDTVFLHPLVMHGSVPNNTKTFRKSILSIYVNSNCKFIDFKGTSREDLEKTMLDGYRRKHPFLKSYLDAWRFRSRIIRGPPGFYQRYLSQL